MRWTAKATWPSTYSQKVDSLDESDLFKSPADIYRESPGKQRSASQSTETYQPGRIKHASTKGWGDGSMGKGPDLQDWGPSSISRTHVQQKQAWTVSCAHNPRTEEAETGTSWGLHSQPTSHTWQFPGQWETCLQSQRGWHLRNASQDCPLDSTQMFTHVCTHMCICVHTHPKTVQWFSMLLSFSSAPTPSTIRLRKTQQ